MGRRVSGRRTLYRGGAGEKSPKSEDWRKVFGERKYGGPEWGGGRNGEPVMATRHRMVRPARSRNE